jgi:hypothetical protein
MNDVVSEVPFRTTVEVATNPVPRTVSVTPVDPGVMLTGDTISTNGTGLFAAWTPVAQIALNKIIGMEQITQCGKCRAITEHCA